MGKLLWKIPHYGKHEMWTTDYIRENPCAAVRFGLRRKKTGKKVLS